ncbi:DUF4978 domain-containing protein [Sporolactobacillus shoreicorticis]|uniref:DUF4978 domain-containing protein n=1 Tax=Sporolactobacillus shoreicorticis TaxID=1923877 RepID=A0ABW5S9W6_9BACL|nr:DUF4978 domain-containing protein [Sporolactobacillus shoreicorticis]MCO7127887.1 DUF4978 domain-containing protein [Sporolactobacillus shoreicorticis]
MKTSTRFLHLGVALLVAAGGFTIHPLQSKAEVNKNHNPASKIVINQQSDYNRAFDKNQILEVRNGNSSSYRPLFYNGIQIRIDKLRDIYSYNINDIRNAFKQAKNDGFTVINSQILWSDIQKDPSLNPSDIAYIKNGDDAKTDFDESKTTLKLQNSSQSKSLVYLKYNLNQLTNGKFKFGAFDGAKLRIYAMSASDAKLTIYGLDKDNNWNGRITWNTAPFKGTGLKSSSASPKYDPIKNENYYDFDVTHFVNKQNHGKVTLVLQADASAELDMGGGAKIADNTSNEKALNEKPRLLLSKKNNYDYDYLDQIIKAARDANIKLEILWFGSDTTKVSTEWRMPFYVLHNYQKVLKQNGDPVFKKSGPTSAIGQYSYLMDKNDFNLQKQEGTVVKNVFNHIAKDNKKAGYTNTVIGAQMPNEPSITRSYARASNEAREAHQDLTDAQFNTWTLWNYTNNLAAQIKESNYPVWTRVNNAPGDGGDSLVAWNEKQRQDEATRLDAVGIDPYTYNYDQLYKVGHTQPYAQGQNLPMIMEDGLGIENSWAEGNYAAEDAGLRIITALAGGATHNYYDFKSGDGFDLYDSENADGTFKPHIYKGSAAIDSIRNVNHLLTKIGHALATKQADGAGGKQLLFFNAVPAAGDSFTDTKKLNNTEVTYRTDSNKSMGIALQRDKNNIVLASTLDSDATFTLKGVGKIRSVKYGQYKTVQSDKWETTDGHVKYKNDKNGTITITVPDNTVVNVSKKTYNSHSN